MSDDLFIKKSSSFEEEVMMRAEELAANNESAGVLNESKYQGLMVFICDPNEDYEKDKRIMLSLAGKGQLDGKIIVVGGYGEEKE